MSASVNPELLGLSVLTKATLAQPVDVVLDSGDILLMEMSQGVCETRLADLYRLAMSRSTAG